MIMGAIILAGIYGAVNALFLAVTRMLDEMSVQGMLPSFQGERRRPYFSHLLLAAVIMILLITGMAGSPNLDIYIKAALLFWLITYVFISLSALIVGRHLVVTDTEAGKGFLVGRLVAMSLLLFCFLGLLFGEKDLQLLLRTMIVAFMSAFLCGSVWVVYYRRNSQYRNIEK
jgi:amino acid transporter